MLFVAGAVVLGDGLPARGHNLSVEHTAGAVCIVDQFGGVGLQSWVGNMVAFPLSYPFPVGGGMNGGTNYRPTFSPSWVWYSVRAWWHTGAGWTNRDGNWIAAQGQLGGATHPGMTLVLTPEGWKTASVNLLYPGAEYSRPDASLVRLPGRGWYWLEGHFFWSAVFDGAGRVVSSAVDHWEPGAWINCQ
jgi:hypothetical protein